MVYVVCNNANLKIDGIGDYAYLLCKELINHIPEIRLLSAASGKRGFINKLCSLAMMRLLLRLEGKIEEGDVVIIEYPFAECNMMVLPALKRLKCSLLKKNGRLILSLHEYDRANFYRKYIIRHIFPLADVVLVTDQAMQCTCRHYVRDVRIRTIPSNIYQGEQALSVKDNSQYVFLGLIDKTKAINEMVEAWRIFNKNGNKKLTILTSSIFNNHFESYGIDYKRNLEINEIGEYFKKAAFCILPINPEVGYNNATYKTAICFECIPIGHFKQNMDNDSFVININDNSVCEIHKGLERSATMSEEDYSKMKESIHRQKKPAFRETALQYLDVIRN